LLGFLIAVYVIPKKSGIMQDCCFAVVARDVV
jgi:hypothetical protein